MKLYSKLLFAGSALLAAGALSSCEEGKTLEDANVVYIEMNASEITLCYGDTIKIGATVSNESGDIINTPITWSVDDENVARLLGDSAIVSVEGAQGRSTKVRATLKNGKYALSNVYVTANTPRDIFPVDTAGVAIASRTSYYITHDSVIFKVNPRTLLYDFEPTYELSGDGLVPYEAMPMTVNKEAGTVSVHYGAARMAGEGLITLKVGPEGGEKEGSCVIKLDPPYEGATFYGPDYAGMPYIGSRPVLHTLRMYYANTYDRIMDVGVLDTCRVAVNIQTGDEVDIKEAYKKYQWVPVSGNSVLVSAMYEDYVEGHGFDAVLVVRSGITEGETIYEMRCPTDTLTATFTVFDYKNTFPVDEIICDYDSVSMMAGETVLITTSVVPMSSYGYHKPRVVAADPTIVQVGEYESNQVPLRGLKPGKTFITLYSNDKTLTIPVEVRAGVELVLWPSNENKNTNVIFEGYEVEWLVDVRTPDGSANVLPVSWNVVTNPDVVSVQPHATDINRAIVKGLKAGTATIRAKCLDKESDAANITVLTRPVNTNVTADDEIGVFFDTDKNMLVVSIMSETGQFPYSNVEINIEGSDEVFTTYTIGGNSYIVLDNGVLPITGTLTISENPDDDEMLVINGSIVLHLADGTTATYTFNNVDGFVW